MFDNVLFLYVMAFVTTVYSTAFATVFTRALCFFLLFLAGLGQLDWFRVFIYTRISKNWIFVLLHATLWIFLAFYLFSFLYVGMNVQGLTWYVVGGYFLLLFSGAELANRLGKSNWKISILCWFVTCVVGGLYAERMILRFLDGS